MITKKPWLSKTLWVNLILGVSAMFIPGVHDWVLAHGDIVASIFAGLNILLRFITKGSIQLVDDSPSA